jgi:hypothetical protein
MMCRLATLVLFTAAGCGRQAIPGPDATVPDGGDIDAMAAGDVTPPGADHAANRRPALTEARSFVVEGTLTLSPLGQVFGPVYVPDRHDFTLRIDPAGPTLTIGQMGFVVEVPARSTDGLTFEATAPVRMPIYPPSACGSSASYDKLTVTITDAGIEGRAEGRVEVIMGDVGNSYHAVSAMTGRPDRTGPTFAPTEGEVDPLEPLVLQALEPLPTGTQGALVNGTEMVALDPLTSPGSQLVVGFSKPLVALRYGARYELVVKPLVDLAGNTAPPPSPITTRAAPPLVPEDGFESAPDLMGDVRIVGPETIPPITGQRSALVSPPSYSGQGAPLLIRLARAPGDHVVRASVRLWSLYMGQSFSLDARVRVAVPGGSMADAILPQHETLDMRQEVSGVVPTNTIWMGPVHTVEVTIPDGAGPELIFKAGSAPLRGCGLIPPGLGMLVDDVRAE